MQFHDEAGEPAASLEFVKGADRMRRAWAMFRIDKEWKEQMLEQSRGLLPEGAIAGQGLTVPADLSRPRRTKEAGRKS